MGHLDTETISQREAGLPTESTVSILGMLGLASRAGQARAGMSIARILIRTGKARLVVVAEDCSENTRKMVTQLTDQHAVPVLVRHTCEELAVCFDGAPRSVVTILDRHFARGILAKAGVRSPRKGRTQQGEA